jgi:hypothetical protein
LEEAVLQSNEADFSDLKKLASDLVLILQRQERTAVTESVRNEQSSSSE